MKKYSSLIQVIVILLISAVYIGSTPAIETLNWFDITKFTPKTEVSIFDVLNRIIILMYLIAGFYLIKKTYFIIKDSTDTIQSTKYFLLTLWKILLILLIGIFIISMIKWAFGCLC